MVLHGLKFYDLEKIKEEYDSLPAEIKEFSDKVRNDLSLETNTVDNYVGHKKYIEIVKNQPGQGNTWGTQ